MKLEIRGAYPPCTKFRRVACISSEVASAILVAVYGTDMIGSEYNSRLPLSSRFGNKGFIPFQINTHENVLCVYHHDSGFWILEVSRKDWDSTDEVLNKELDELELNYQRQKH